MRRRLLSQSGLDGIHDMVCYINRSVSQTPIGTVRVKFAKAPDDVSNSDVFLDKSVTNGGNGASPYITIASNELVDKLTALGLRRSSTFYYGLFPTTSNQGVIVAGTSSDLIKQQYKSQSISDLFTSGATVNWYNSCITISVAGTPISFGGGSATLTVYYSYANWSATSLSNTTGFSITNSSGGSLTSTGTKVYTVTATANTSRSEKSTIFSLTTGTILNDAVVNNNISIIQSVEPYYFTITGSKTDYKGKMPIGGTLPARDIPSEITMSDYGNKSIYLHTNIPTFYNSNGYQIFGVSAVWVYELSNYTNQQYTYVYAVQPDGSKTGIEFKRTGTNMSSGIHLNKYEKQSDTFFACGPGTSWWQKSGASNSDYYIELNSSFSFERDSYRYAFGSYPSSDQIYVKFDFNYADYTNNVTIGADIENAFYVKVPLSSWI